LCAGGADLPKKTLLRVLKKAPKNNGVGAPLGHSNSLKHGAFSKLARRNMDQRSSLARVSNAVEGELVSSVGGNPSPQEMILIQRACFKMIKCVLYEAASLNDEGKSTDEVYLSWANSLRQDLVALGLARRQKDITDLLKAMAMEAGRHE
jgi:hypothetical protein